MAYEQFPSWSALLQHVEDGEDIYYQGALAPAPYKVECALRPNGKLRVFLSRHNHNSKDITVDEDDLSFFKKHIGIYNYVLLLNRTTNESIFTMNTGEQDIDLGYWHILGYVDTREEARLILYGRS